MLAAGHSRRFGRGDKLLAPLGGRPVLLHSLSHALAAPVQRVLVVVPPGSGRVARLVRRHRSRRLQLVVARERALGMHASLAAGLAAVRPIERELLVFLGDMPLARAWPGLRMPPGRDAVRPSRAGMPGHPVLARTTAAKRLRAGEADRGLIARVDPARKSEVSAADGNFLDIDTLRGLRRARAAVTRGT